MTTTKPKRKPAKPRTAKTQAQPKPYKPDKPRLSAGRPPIFTEELGDEICLRLSNGESLRAICDDAKMPDRATVMRWLADPGRSDFATKYARAREKQIDAFAEDIAYIADTEPDPARARVRMEARRWLAERTMPKKYGAKVEHGGAGPGGAILIQFAEGDDKLG